MCVMQVCSRLKVSCVLQRKHFARTRSNSEATPQVVKSEASENAYKFTSCSNFSVRTLSYSLSSLLFDMEEASSQPGGSASDGVDAASRRSQLTSRRTLHEVVVRSEPGDGGKGNGKSRVGDEEDGTVRSRSPVPSGDGTPRRDEVAVDTNVLIQSQLRGEEHFNALRQFTLASRLRDDDDMSDGDWHGPDRREEINLTKQMVAKELGAKIDEDTFKLIKKETLRLESKIDSLQKNNQYTGKVQEELAILDGGGLPSSVRKVSIAFENAILDSHLLEEPIFIGASQVVPEGVSIREAKERLHRMHTIEQKKLDLLLCQKRRESLRLQTKKSTFVAACMAGLTKQEARWNSLDLDLEDDCCDVRGITPSQQEVKLHVI